MKESVIYQEILLEGIVEGEAKGKAANQIALNMMHSGISIDLICQFTGLTMEQIQKLQ
jgi:predicted transposase YdaD